MLFLLLVKQSYGQVSANKVSQEAKMEHFEAKVDRLPEPKKDCVERSLLIVSSIISCPNRAAALGKLMSSTESLLCCRNTTI